MWMGMADGMEVNEWEWNCQDDNCANMKEEIASNDETEDEIEM